MSSTTRATASRDAFVNLARAYEELSAGFQALFREHGLTMGQFNVLRILRGAGRGGASCMTIGERLIHRVPDVTRLIDRMERAELVTRERSTEDRRVVHVRLTPKGRRLCDSLEQPVLDLHESQLAAVSLADLRTLDRILRRLAG